MCLTEQIDWLPKSSTINIDGMEVLRHILADDVIQLGNHIAFLDNPACKYAYFIDFETRRVEVFAGTHRAAWMFEELEGDCFEEIETLGGLVKRAT